MSNAVHGRLGSILFNEFDLSRYLNKINVNRDAPELGATTFQAAAKEYVADFPSCSTSLEGFFSHDATELDTANDEFEAALSDLNSQVVTLCPDGNSFGKRALLQEAVETKHTISAPVAGLITCMADLRGEVSHGVLLAAKTARTSTGNGTAVDNAVPTYGGAVGHQHVFSKSGTLPTLDTKVQHSADNSTYADLITFAQKIAAGSERVKVAGLTAVAQVETATVTGPATASANVIVVVTAAGVTGSPISTNVAVLNGDTAAQVAGKIRTALGLVAAITAVYTVGGSSATITLTKISPTVNDATLNIAIDGTTNSTGVPDAASSTNTTPGVAGGTVNRYVRESRTIGGSGSPTFTNCVGFARL